MGKVHFQRIERIGLPAWRALVDGLFPRRCIVCGDYDVVDPGASIPSALVDVCAAHRIEHGLYRAGGPEDRASRDGPEGRPGGRPEGSPDESPQGWAGVGAIDNAEADARCPRCLALLPAGMSSSVRCRTCRQRPPGFVGAAAAFHYAEPGVSDWVLRLKHGARTDLAAPLAQMAWMELMRTAGAAKLLVAPRPGDIFVPVPLHPTRLVERGYNQAALVASELARLAKGHYFPILQRQRSTFVQGEFAAPSRRLNVQGAFRVTSSVDLGRVVRRGHRVWIVDDVMTTGATASACAAALRKAGGGEIRVVTLARA